MREVKHVNLKTYAGDGRKPVGDLYDDFERFEDDFWIRNRIHNQEFKTKRKGRKHTLPIFGYRTELKGPAIWIISGIHGEEPAGPNAIAEHIGFLNDLAKKIPLVVLPLCNPVGYTLNWRYPDLRRYKKGFPDRSVGSSEHFLPDLKDPKKARSKKPLCEEAEDITNYVIKNIKRYPPVLVLDFHEEEGSTSTYIDSQGKLGLNDPVAKEVVAVLKTKDFKIRMKGKTQFGEIVFNGIIKKFQDSSIDELLASKYIIVNGNIKRKIAAKSVVVIETNTINVPIKHRIKTHAEILLSADKFFDMARTNGKK